MEHTPDTIQRADNLETVNNGEKASEQPVMDNIPEKNKNNIHTDFDTALYTLWFGLSYGSILTSAALYKTLESLGKKPCLMQKPPQLWTEHYADKGNIAGLFAYENCKVLEIFDNEDDMRLLNEQIKTHITGSDIVWSYDVVGRSGNFFFLVNADDNVKKVAYSSSFGGSLPDNGIRNEYYHLLRRFDSISVPDDNNASILQKQFNIQTQTVLDPIFLCDKGFYLDCAARSSAKEHDAFGSCIFVHMDHGDERKRAYTLRGNEILLAKSGSPLRCMIDINRYAESKEESGLEPARYINAEDWLHYIINSEFVITDNIYAVYFALIFEKPFAILVNEDEPNLARFKEFLKSLGLDERIVVLQGDLKTKEYLFRKPVKYSKVTPLLAELKAASLQWLKAALDEGKIPEEGENIDGKA